MTESTALPRPWDEANYQRFADATGTGHELVVRFENGDEVRLDVRRLLSDVAREAPLWDELDVGPYEIVLPVDGDSVELAWHDVRALSDDAFASHLAERAHEQARQVGHRLRLLRERRGLSARELAERAGLSAQSLSRIERGRHDVVFSTLQRLLAAMNYELPDLASVGDIEVAPEQVKKSLAATGLHVETVERILRGTHDAPSALARVRKIFSWSPTDVAGPSAPPLLGSPAFAGRFKAHARDHRAAMTYVMYAHTIALLADQAARRPTYDAPPDNPRALANAVRTRYGDLRFASLARYCWDVGIVLVPLFDPAQFHGACWLIGERPVVVLKQRASYDSRWVFDLSHEVCHVLRHLGPEDIAIVELEEIGHSDDEQELEASAFAGELLLGDPDALAKRVVEVARGRGPRLKNAIPPVAEEAGVDAGVLANYVAYRLDQQGFEFPFWTVAAKLQQGDRDAPNIALQLLEEHLDWDLLSDDDAMILKAAINPREDDA